MHQLERHQNGSGSKSIFQKRKTGLQKLLQNNRVCISVLNEGTNSLTNTERSDHGTVMHLEENGFPLRNGALIALLMCFQAKL